MHATPSRALAHLVLVAVLAWATLAAGGRQTANLRFSIEAKDRTDAFTWYPLAIGNSWTRSHRHETALGGTDEIAKVTWDTTETVVEHKRVAQGTIVLTTTEVENVRFSIPRAADPAGVQWLRRTYPPRDPSALLVSGSYVYVLSGRYYDGESRTVSTAAVEEMARGEMTPAFFFPLLPGTLWAERQREERDVAAIKAFEAGRGGAPNPGMYYWHVLDPEDTVVPAGTFVRAAVLRYYTNGGPTTVWFQRGIGIVREWTHHSGTYIESHSELLRYRVKPSAGSQGR